jgi:hypothetical protein
MKYKLCGFEIPEKELTSKYSIMTYIFSRLDEYILISDIHKKINRINEFVNLYNEKVGVILLDNEIEGKIYEYLRVTGLMLKHFGDYKIKLYYGGYLHIDLFESIKYEDLFSSILSDVTMYKYKYGGVEIDLNEVLKLLNNVNEFNIEYARIIGIEYFPEYHFHQVEFIKIIEIILKYNVNFVFTDDMNFIMLHESIADGVTGKALEALEKGDGTEEYKLVNLVEYLNKTHRKFVEMYMLDSNNGDYITNNYMGTRFCMALKNREY